MTWSQFLNDDRDTTFVDRVTAFLDIPTNQMKIVGSDNSEPSAEASRRRNLATSTDSSTPTTGINFFIDSPTPVF